VVPDVVGQPEPDAKQQLSAAGFATQSVLVPNAGFQPGTVVDQDPGGGTTAPPGSTVTLFVAQP
jgi:serine/threonine-protein kinase